MFSPTPSTTTDTGYVACSCAPARNSGLRGPGTFEITRFTGGRVRPRICIVVRAASAATAGGMNAVASVSRSAGRALCRSLALRRSSWVRRRRSAGSGSSVGIGTIIIETRLPYVPCCSSVRTDMGTIATSGSSGSASRSRSHWRTAPAQSATTTSLTVRPSAPLSALTAASESWPNAKRRCAEIGPLNGVRGGRAVVASRTAGSWPPIALRTRPTARETVGPPGRALTPGSSVTFGSVVGIERSARSGWAGSPRATRPRSSRQPAAGAAEQLEVAGRAARRRRGIRRRQLAALGAGVEQHGEDLVARDAVDDGVVDLRQQRDVAVRQAVDQVDLPQRAVAIERAGEDAGDGLGEPPVVAWRRDGGLADVEVEVEVGVLDPVRQVDAERHAREAPLQRRQEMDALADEPAEVGDLERAARRGGRVVDREAADVPVGARGLHGQELRVQRRELPHPRHLPGVPRG